MRTWMAGTVLLPAAAVLLAACGERDGGPLAPLPVRATVLSASGPCNGVNPTSASSFGGLPMITITATFSGAALGLPSNLLQQMNFGYGDASMVPCANTVDVTYAVRDVEQEDTLDLAIPVPAGVDPSAWGQLSNRERAKLLKVAELIFSVAPAFYGSPGAVIQQKLLPATEEAKVRAKIRALDFLAGRSAELLAGGIYGCLLFQNLTLDPGWVLMRRETLQLTADLSAAFAESLFDTKPLSGIVFARNGAFGADIASRATTLPVDCGWAVFSATGSGRVVIDDPYAPPTGGPSPKPFVPDGGGTWDR